VAIDWHSSEKLHTSVVLH